MLWHSVHSAKRKNAEACVLSVCRSAYHLNGKSGYSGENSNGTVHYQSQASSREKAKILPALLNPIFSVFSSKKYQYNISRQIFTVIFYQMLQIAAFNMQRLVNWGRRRRGERWQFFGQMTNISVQMKASYVPLNSQVKSFIVNKIDMKFFCVVQNNFKLLETFSIMTLMVNGKPEDVMWPQWSRLQFAVHAWSFEALSFQR